MDMQKNVIDIVSRYNEELMVFKQKMEKELNPYKGQITDLSSV